jgi:hypothetical protein
MQAKEEKVRGEITELQEKHTKQSAKIFKL